MPVPGFLYVLSNPALPGLYKVGRTARTPYIRARELSSPTGWPVTVPFRVEHFVFVQDTVGAERLMRNQLRMCGFRYVFNREFFTARLDNIIWLMDYIRETKSDFQLEVWWESLEDGGDEPSRFDFMDWELNSFNMAA
jgi:hypothetical protein